MKFRNDDIIITVNPNLMITVTPTTPFLYFTFIAKLFFIQAKWFYFSKEIKTKKPLIHNQQKRLLFLDVSIDNEYQLSSKFGSWVNRLVSHQKMLGTKGRRNVDQGGTLAEKHNGFRIRKACHHQLFLIQLNNHFFFLGLWWTKISKISFSITSQVGFNFDNLRLIA